MYLSKLERVVALVKTDNNILANENLKTNLPYAEDSKM